MPRSSPLARLIVFAAVAVTALAAIALLVVASYHAEAAGWLLAFAGKALLVTLLVAAAAWLLARGLQRFLWRVGRRLAFSYFLIGVVPIPMGLLFVLLNVYLLSGYFTGHLFRDAAGRLEADLAAAAAARLESWSTDTVSSADGTIGFAYYRDGRRIAGVAEAPADWPRWLDRREPGSSERRRDYVDLGDDRTALAATATADRNAVLSLYRGELEAELTRRSGVWVELMRADDPRRESLVRLRLGGREYALLPIGIQRAPEDRERFFGAAGEEAGWLEKPLLLWGEVGGTLRRLDTGEAVTDFVVASLNANLKTVARHLASGSGEVDTAVWASLIAVSGLLATIYGLAVGMALWMIFSLSRAVNRLSRATDAVQRGDFSIRIRSRRRDQIGALERSFNEMTANLAQLVEATAEREALEKELTVARDLQQSLLPANVPATEAFEFSTLFQPSAAIGGDYFDILRVDEDRLAVVVADVSGHGLPTGLRMAMLKAALVILVEERKPAEEILRRLNTMVRAERRQRFFVTATIGVLDFRRDRLQITNAGHPPTYVVRDGAVEEIVLPGSPLGALGEEYGRRELEVAPGDVVVWLSDGLIEAADPHDEPFGYERTRDALVGPAPSAATVRDRLLAAVQRHGAGRPIDDDRTLVAMRYRPGAG